ncbi:MAG: hypothetical protein GX187_07685 [Clostridiaceae bacterium]|nr:hypothetical protein [Clostridiaceae bacterium]
MNRKKTLFSFAFFIILAVLCASIMLTKQNIINKQTKLDKQVVLNEQAELVTDIVNSSQDSPFRKIKTYPNRSSHVDALYIDVERSIVLKKLRVKINLYVFLKNQKMKRICLLNICKV